MQWQSEQERKESKSIYASGKDDSSAHVGKKNVPAIEAPPAEPVSSSAAASA